jgi:lysophospholipase L1-like esterase
VDFARLEHALADIKATADAHHAQMAVFLIPTLTDFLRYHQSGTDRVGPAVASWGQTHGIPVKDLLPEMNARAAGNYRNFFLGCDGHWSPQGGQVAADVLKPWLDQLNQNANKVP